KIMKTLGKILGYIARALVILLICTYLIYYINLSLPLEHQFLSAEVIDILNNYVFKWAALIIVGIIVLTTMMKHSIVLTIIFAVLIGAVAIFMIVGQANNTADTETVINLVKALV
ncbi:MAG: hypothetical protein K2N47_00575, partial [Clostridia bacterium]|nr:hypothetical protein [Clostridia bacterium]